MRSQVLDLDPVAYRPSELHGSSRVWQETNCAADLWIEAIHALGFDPVHALAFTLSSDFDGDQWRMFKFPQEDLRRVFGLEFDELNVWRPLIEHLEEQIELGRLLTIDVDGWDLPDTAGLTYHVAHQKTTVMAQMIDTGKRELGYFHNASYYVLDGEDFEHLIGSWYEKNGPVLPPYVEVVRLDRSVGLGAEPKAHAVELAFEHLARRPATNPLTRMRKRIDDDIEWLSQQDFEVFHRYAFGTVRQCGANAELCATYLSWLAREKSIDLSGAVSRFVQIATGMKAFEFVLARAARGRPVNLSESFAAMEDGWDQAMELLEREHGT